MKIVVASLPDREKVVVELWCEDGNWAEINQETDNLLIELYPRRSGGPWSFTVDEVLDLLHASRQALPGTAEQSGSDTPPLVIQKVENSSSTEPVAEFWFEGKMWASMDGKNLNIYPKGSGEPWVLPLKEVIDVLEEASGVA
jgi:hypothetical protein